jgi:hemerythrin superfamily protein
MAGRRRPSTDKKKYSAPAWHASCSFTDRPNFLGGTHMNALEILKQDHLKVKQLFEEATHASNRNQRKDLFDKSDTELEIHAHIEETVFYPALEQHEELQEMVAEALEELAELGSESHDFGGKLQELMESVEHHVAPEEGEMFPKFAKFSMKESLMNSLDN